MSVAICQECRKMHDIDVRCDQTMEAKESRLDDWERRFERLTLQYTNATRLLLEARTRILFLESDNNELRAQLQKRSTDGQGVMICRCKDHTYVDDRSKP
jgi:ribosomal protein L44E